jgi:hypothetical protein
MSLAARDIALETGLAVMLVLLMLSLVVIARHPAAAGGTRAGTVDDPAGSVLGAAEPSPGRHLASEPPQGRPLATGPLGGTLVTPDRPHRGDMRPAHGPYAPRHGRGRRE